MSPLTDTHHLFVICLFQTETGLRNMIMQWIKNLTVELLIDDVYKQPSENKTLVQVIKTKGLFMSMAQCIKLTEKSTI